MKKTRKILMAIFLFVIAITLVGCKNEKSIDVLATSYVGYDISKNIAGDKLKVKNLIKPGESMHNKEFVSKDLTTVNDSRLIIYTSSFFDIKLVEHDEFKKQKNKINLFKELYPDVDEDHIIAHTHDHGGCSHDDHHHDEHNHDPHHHHDEHNHDPHHHHNEHHHDPHHHYDEHDHIHDYIHFFTSVDNIIKMVDIIKDKIISLDKENKDYYEKNAKEYQDAIKKEKESLISHLKDKTKKDIFFLGHDSFGLFGKELELNIIPFHGHVKEDALKTSEEFIEFKTNIDSKKPKYLFVAELGESDKLKEALKEELKCDDDKFLILHSFHNVSKEDENKTLVDLIKQNFENIKKAITE